ncbi:MAG: LOG family protein [Actinobacteria bacterium]|nr:LOG family protein [Actinomycetota bacterium]
MPTIAVIGSSRTQPDHPDYQDAQRLGRLLADAGFTVASGGYGGLMEAVSKGARSVGGPVVGVTAPGVFPDRARVNEYVTDEQPAETLTERIHRLVYGSDAVVALPGSIGTLTELMSAWNLAYVAPFSGRMPKPVVAVGALWAEVVSWLAERLETDGTLVTLVDNVDEAFREIVERVKSITAPERPGMLNGGADTSGALP